MGEGLRFERLPRQPEQESKGSVAEMRKKLRDPIFLPTHEYIEQAFPNSSSRHEFYDFCEGERENAIFEFLNEEYIDALSNYLVERIKGINKEDGRPVTILELGAGDGRLSHFLDERIANISSEYVRVIATDDGDWGRRPVFPVNKEGFREALFSYDPDIVLVSWMPYEEDWTDDIRKTKSVQEYILIGDSDMTGDSVDTWGGPNYDLQGKDLEEEIDRVKSEPLPWQKDGFERKYLRDVSELQICKLDHPRSKSYGNSSTYSFRREF